MGRRERYPPGCPSSPSYVSKIASQAAAGRMDNAMKSTALLHQQQNWMIREEGTLSEAGLPSYEERKICP